MHNHIYAHTLPLVIYILYTVYIYTSIVYIDHYVLQLLYFPNVIFPLGAEVNGAFWTRNDKLAITLSVLSISCTTPRKTPPKNVMTSQADRSGINLLQAKESKGSWATFGACGKAYLDFRSSRWPGLCWQRDWQSDKVAACVRTEYTGRWWQWIVFLCVHFIHVCKTVRPVWCRHGPHWWLVIFCFMSVCQTILQISLNTWK